MAKSGLFTKIEKWPHSEFMAAATLYTNADLGYLILGASGYSQAKLFRVEEPASLDDTPGGLRIADVFERVLIKQHDVG